MLHDEHVLKVALALEAAAAHNKGGPAVVRILARDALDGWTMAATHIGDDLVTLRAEVGQAVRWVVTHERDDQFIDGGDHASVLAGLEQFAEFVRDLGGDA